MTQTPPDYDALIAVLRARADEIGLSTAYLDYATGLPSGYVGKLFGPSRVKKMGLESLYKLARELALRCNVTLVPDLELAQLMEARWERRDELRRRPGVIRKHHSPELRREILRDIGRMGKGVPKGFGITRKQLSAKQRRNAKKGWKTRRQRVIRASECPPLSPSLSTPAATASPASQEPGSRRRCADTAGGLAPASRRSPCRPA